MVAGGIPSGGGRPAASGRTEPAAGRDPLDDRGTADQFLRPNPGHGLSGLDETGSEGVGRRRSLATVSAVCAVVSAGYVVVSADCGGVFGVSGCRRRFRASNTHREAAPRTERAHLASA